MYETQNQQPSQSQLQPQPSYAPQPLSNSRNISINLINQSKTSLDHEIPLFENNQQRNFYESLSELYSIIVAINCLEKSFTKDTLSRTSSEQSYTNTTVRLLNQFNIILKDDEVRENFQDLDSFCKRMGIDVPLAKKRILIGVPATVESVTGASSLAQSSTPSNNNLIQDKSRRGASNQDGDSTLVSYPSLSNPENNVSTSHINSNKYSTRAVAEATGAFITTMDALKLNYRSKDELHPLLSDLMTSINKVLNNGDFKNRSKLIQWLIKLNNLKFNERLGEEEGREFLFDLESAYKGFYECLE